MVTIDELRQLAEEVLDMAELARMTEEWDAVFTNSDYVSDEDRQEALKEVVSDASRAGYREEFECIVRWLDDIDGIDDGGNDMLTSFFDHMVTYNFGDLRFENGEFEGSPDFDLLEEYTRLYGVVVKESRGELFKAFAENFLVPLPRMWQYQTAIAMSLGASAKLTNELYNRAREDAATLAKEAKTRFAIIAGQYDDGFGPLQMGLLSLALGIAGYITGPVGIVATTFGNFLTMAGLLGATPPPKEAPKTETVTGDTAVAVRDSLNYALDDHVLIPLRDGEVKIQEALEAMNDFLDEPETRAHVLAADSSFPKPATP